MQRKIAVFPGSFDPVTSGHVDLIQRAAGLFDMIVVAIGINSRKKYLFPLDQRKIWLEKTFQQDPYIEIATFDGLTVDFCKKINAAYLLRGLRHSGDFEYEQTVAQLNRELIGSIETVFLSTTPSLSHISSTIVREILINGGNASPYLPKAVAEEIKAYAGSK